MNGYVCSTVLQGFSLTSENSILISMNIEGSFKFLIARKNNTHIWSVSDDGRTSEKKEKHPSLHDLNFSKLIKTKMQFLWSKILSYAEIKVQSLCFMLDLL